MGDAEQFIETGFIGDVFASWSFSASIMNHALCYLHVGSEKLMFEHLDQKGTAMGLRQTGRYFKRIDRKLAERNWNT